MIRRAPRLLVCALVALGAAGCARTQPLPAARVTPPPSQAATEGSSHPAPGATTLPKYGLSEMPAEQKVAELDSNFVTEWPVVAGQVGDVALVGGKVLQFTVDVPAPWEAVVSWYDNAMRGRAFVASGRTEIPGGGAELRYSRALVRYVIRITPLATGQTRVQSAITTGPKWPIITPRTRGTTEPESTSGS